MKLPLFTWLNSKGFLHYGCNRLTVFILRQIAKLQLFIFGIDMIRYYEYYGI
jgi:hypothetical protein